LSGSRAESNLNERMHIEDQYRFVRVAWLGERVEIGSCPIRGDLRAESQSWDLKR